VLAVFFLGLALGGYLFGNWSPRLAQPLRAYAGLEIVLAALIVATLPLFDLAESLYGALYRAAGTSEVVLHAARAGLVGLASRPRCSGRRSAALLPAVRRHAVDSGRHGRAAVRHHHRQSRR
jgi:hypothetical protein